MLKQSPKIPSVAEVISPILARVPVIDQPLLLALAERLAAARYRTWADREGDAADRMLLLGCAEREDEIAARIESLRPEAKAVQKRLLEQHPDLVDLDRELFAGRPLREQYAIQAKGERLGAATWKAVAAASRHSAVRELFLDCARLEEDSALVLETLLQRGRMLD